MLWHADEAIALLKAMTSHSRLLLCQLAQRGCSAGALAQSSELTR